MALPTLGRLRSAVTGGVMPVVPPVPTTLPPQGQADWLSRIARTLNLALNGKINCTIDVVLRADETTTSVFDSRIGAWSVILPMPVSGGAAVALAASMWIVPQTGVATIHHVSAPETDQHFRLAIFS